MRSAGSGLNLTSRPIASGRSRAAKKSRPNVSAMAWKLQGADPMARVVVVVSLNLLDPLLDAMEAPQSPPPAPSRFDIQLVNPHPESLAEITVEYPISRNATSSSASTCRTPIRTTIRSIGPRVQMELLREAEAKYTEATASRWLTGNAA